MTDTDQFLALAKYEGWTYQNGYCINPKGEIYYKNSIPNYDDLNRLHLLEKQLNYEQRVMFDLLVNQLPSLSLPPIHGYAWHIDAKNRREILIKSLGLWKE